MQNWTEAMTNQPAPEKCCPTCGSNNPAKRDSVGTPIDHWKCNDRWHGVLPVEPLCICGKPERHFNHTGDTEDTPPFTITAETVPVVPPENEGRRMQADLEHGPSDTLPSGEVTKTSSLRNERPSELSGVVPQGAEQRAKFESAAVAIEKFSPHNFKRRPADGRYVLEFHEFMFWGWQIAIAHAAASQAEKVKCPSCGNDVNDVLTECSQYGHGYPVSESPAENAAGAQGGDMRVPFKGTVAQDAAAFNSPLESSMNAEQESEGVRNAKQLAAGWRETDRYIAELKAKIADLELELQHERVPNIEKLRRERETKRLWQERAEKAERERDQAREALRKLRNEVLAVLGLARAEILAKIGNTNYSVLRERLDEAAAVPPSQAAPQVKIKENDGNT